MTWEEFDQEESYLIDEAEGIIEKEQDKYINNLLERVNVFTEFDTSKLTPDQKTKFNQAKEDLSKNCLGAALLAATTKANIEIGGTLGPGQYNPVSNTIKFRSNDDIGAGTLGAELFHAYQQQLYGTLSDIYKGTKTTGGSNMEFEEKAFNIMSDMIESEQIVIGDRGIGVGSPISVNEEVIMLYDWLRELEFNHQTAPINLSAEELASWFEALEVFQQHHEGNPDHYGDPIDVNQKPDAILNLINKILESDCN